MSLSIEESEPSSSVEQTEARQALYTELEDIAEQHRHEHELVDKFVDSRGIERKPSAELVRLNPEAVEAIESYFTEHDELADSIEALLVFTQDLAPHATKLVKEYESGQNPKPLAKLTDPVQLQSVIESVMSAPSVQPEVVLPEELATKITAEIQKIEEATKILNLPAPSQDAGSIIAFVEALPEGVRQSWQFPGNIKLRMSGRARSESLDNINTLIANTQGGSRLAKSTLSELLAQHLPTTIAPVFEQVRPLQTSIDTENHGHDTWNRRLKSQNAIDHRIAPTQNEVVVAELIPDIQELTKQFEYISSCEAALQSALASPQILAALRHLEASDIAMLSESVAKVNQSELASPSIEPIMKGFEQTYQMAPIVYAEALERAEKAIKTLYNEPALPKLYTSPQEETRLQELIGMYNQLAPAAQLDAQAQLKEIKIPNFEIHSPLKMYTHFTPFMDAILKDGSLRTKQQQIDVLGTLHENTRPGIHKGDVIATHSSVIHFDTLISSYTGSAEGHQSGILFIPLGKIIKTAPIDHLGRRLITLPSSDTQAPPGPSTANFGPPGGDYVFYASPKASERDSYSIELDDGCGAVLIGGEATATAYTRPGAPLVETASDYSQGPVTQASEKIQRELFEHSEFARGIVVPLRIEPMEFEAEVPNGRLPNRFQRSNTKEIRNTSEVKRIRSDSWAN